MLSVVGTRYAKALLDVTMSQDPQKILGELYAVRDLVSASESLHTALLSPAVSPARKRAVMARLVAPMNVSKTVQNFLFVVIDHRRVTDLPAIVEAYEVLLDERLGFVRADVASAHALNDSQKANLEAELSRISGKKAKVAFATDSALIGGVVARVGGKVYDGSVRGQLERLRLKLAAGA
jgi:F-type H+-transporting ATPase subunit delta